MNIRTVDEIFEVNGPIKDLKDDYEPRESQIKMAKTVTKGLSKPSNVLIEGETGSGKSFSYLLPICNEIVNDPEKGSNCHKWHITARTVDV